MPVRVERIDHVQLAIPEGGENEADRFYVGLLGFEVIAKPEPLASRGGRWYRSGPAQIHLGVEQDFRPARKAHPALVVFDLESLAAACADAGYPLRWDDELSGVKRGFIDDPFGNRIELIDSAG